MTCGVVWRTLIGLSTSLAVTQGSDLAAQDSVRFVSVSTGWGHTCALTSAGIARCWGLNNAGQLGSDSATERCQAEPELNPCSTAPLRVKGELRFTSLSLGVRASCGLVVSGAVYCWGDRAYGPPADTAVATWATPVAVADTPAFVSVAGDRAILCGVAGSGAAYCAGRNLSADFDVARRLVLLSGGLTFSTISIGHSFACGLTRDGRAYCWGMDLGWGVLGRRGARSSSPLLIADAPGFRSLSAGDHHVCGVTVDGAAFCWGAGTDGQLGNGSAVSSPRPVRVEAPLVFRSVAAGGRHTCALTAEGVAYCWGSNADGQLGNPDTRDTCDQGVCSRHPQVVLGDLRFTVISAGANHTCSVSAGGAVYCWGGNENGQLGVPQGRKQCGFGRSAEPCGLTPVRVSDPGK